MKHFLTYTTDVHGNKYIVIKFNKNIDNDISGFLDGLKSLVGLNKFNELISNQQARDLRSGSTHTHHTTIVNVMELNKVSKNINKLPTIEDLKMVGIGTAIGDKKNNQSFFIVCQSETVQQFRKSIGLGYKDLHITLGFYDKDVFGKSKGIDSLIK